MTRDIFLLLSTIGISIILFSIERLPADVIALGILLVITLIGLLPVEKAFLGFSSDAVIMILGLLILTAALIRTGVVDLVGRTITKHINHDERTLLLVVMGSSAIISAFISNTAAAAFFIPIVIGIAHRARISSSKLLMPLAFATILSSSVTLVATSTNIVVSGLMTQKSLEPIGMFELAPVGIPILVIGILYMIFIGNKMIPDREYPKMGFEEIGILPYFTEMIILAGSPLIGKSLEGSGLGRDLDLTVLRVVRGKRKHLTPHADLVLDEGDVLLVEGSRNEIVKMKDITSIEPISVKSIESSSLQVQENQLVEVILLLRSPLIGRTLKGINFREKFGLQVLAINRHGETVLKKLSQITFRLGDVLLIQGPSSNISALEADKTFRKIGLVEEKKLNLHRAPYAIIAFIGALILATFNIISLPIALMLGVLVVFLTRCITPEEAYREVEWKILILIACLLAVGTALEYTGTATFLAAQIVKGLGGFHPFWLLSAFFFLTMLLSQPMSNQAAAAVVVPIAMQTALQLDLNPRSFAMIIAIGASCSFLTPLEPACLMVYGSGRYKFIDFLKVGSPLTFLIFIIAILLVPIFWPLN